MDWPQSVTVVVDSREKIPLIFPASTTLYPFRGVQTKHVLQVRTEREALHAGDYEIRGWGKYAKIETKRSMQELHNNLFGDYMRFSIAMDKLAQSCHRSLLLLDFSISAAFRDDPQAPVPEIIHDQLLRACTERNIALWWIGPAKTLMARRRLGTMALRWLLWTSLYMGASCSELMDPSKRRTRKVGAKRRVKAAANPQPWWSKKS